MSSTLRTFNLKELNKILFSINRKVDYALSQGGGGGGVADSADVLTVPRDIQGVPFDGSEDIDIINGTGFVKAAGNTLSYDNSTYLTTASAASAYQPLSANLTSLSSVTLPLSKANGGTGTDLSSTGGTAQVLTQETVGGAIVPRKMNERDLAYTLKGTIITENWANLTNWTSTAGTWTVGSSKVNLASSGANSYSVGIYNSTYGATKLRMWTMEAASVTIPTISATTYGVSLGIHSLSTNQNSFAVRFCMDSTKKGLIEFYYARSVSTIYGASTTPLVISSGDVTSIRVRRYKSTIIATWKNVTTDKSVTVSYEMPSNDASAKQPNYGAFALYSHNNAAMTIGALTVKSDEVVNAKLAIVSDSIAVTSTDAIFQSYPEVLQRMVQDKVIVFAGNGDRIEENNWAEVLAHTPENILISCLTNNVIGDSTSTMLTKLATAITALPGYTYGTNLFITNIMNRNDTDVTAHNTALAGAYSNLIDLSIFKGAGTGINSAKSTDGVHPNLVGHEEYAKILLDYFLANGKLTLDNNPVPAQRMPLYQGTALRLGSMVKPVAFGDLEIENDLTYSQIHLIGATQSSGTYLGCENDTIWHCFAGIKRTGSVYTATSTTFGGCTFNAGKFTIIARTGAVAGTSYTLTDAASSYVWQVESTGKISQPGTLTATGTTGARTINKALGTINLAAGQTSVVLTNSLITANSLVIPVLMTVDSTAKSVAVVPAAGSCTFTLNAACTAEVKIGFEVKEVK